MKYKKTYAVDFDGTLSFAKWPETGPANKMLFAFLKRKQAAGDRIILWTNRNGDDLKRAVEFCQNQGLIFDAVNENLLEHIEFFGGDTRKVYANYYIDDRNLTSGAFFRVLKYITQLKTRLRGAFRLLRKEQKWQRGRREKRK